MGSCHCTIILAPTIASPTAGPVVVFWCRGPARYVRYRGPHRRSRLPHRDRPTQRARASSSAISVSTWICRPSPCASSRSESGTRSISTASPSRRTDEGATSAVSSARLPREPNSHSGSLVVDLLAPFTDLGASMAHARRGGRRRRAAGLVTPLPPARVPGLRGPWGGLPRP